MCHNDGYNYLRVHLSSRAVIPVVRGRHGRSTVNNNTPIFLLKNIQPLNSLVLSLVLQQCIYKEPITQVLAGTFLPKSLYNL
ncbi:hypothetical protein SK128_001346 [Halocaridina rubra]|uniref:Uncharacterized protein n=1 Tax=Halocaridina rubra TaxID=373956 RepID=A0AAN9A869_HALRR